MLAHDSDIRTLLRTPGNRAVREEVDNWLEQANEQAGTTALFIEDQAGTAIASSNWRDPATYVGHNYEFRPYFRDALVKGRGRWFGVGITTKVPGYFLAHAVIDGGETLGVAIAKVDLERLQQEWTSGGEKVFVVDADNIALLSSFPPWKYAVFGEISDQGKVELDSTRKYADISLRPANIVAEAHLAEGIRLLTLETGGRRQTYLDQSAAIPGEPWTIHYLTDMDEILRESRMATVLTALAGTVALLALLFLRQRFLRLTAQSEAREAIARTLARARDDLEVEVAARTAALQEEIIERQRAEEDLRQTQGELVHAGKMAALGQMSAAVAHELSQPLTAIQTYLASSRVFAQRGDLGQVFTNIGQIEDLTRRMAHIASHLKTFSRKGVDRWQKVSLEETMNRAMMLLKGRFLLENVEVDCVIPSHAWVLGDGIRLEQVLVNIIGNALDAMRGCETKVLSIGVREKDGLWAISIADNGPGVPPETSRRMFEPFFTTKEAGEGLGLGLSLSDSIIREMGGTIQASDRPGGGAIFTVALPRHDDDTSSMRGNGVR
jgi:two-component system C4-dicarboxylate transport sensor histidine kinase DctB